MADANPTRPLSATRADLQEPIMTDTELRLREAIIAKCRWMNATGLNQILTQKYLAYARNSGLQAYYQYRRTGVPVFSQGPGVGNSGIIPDRYQYPVNERSANEQNYNEALTRQFGAAGDDIFQPLWIVK